MKTKEEIYQVVDKYLIENIGNLVGPGEPVLDAKLEFWITPIFHMSKAAVFSVGSVIVDKDGNMLDAPTNEEIDGVLERKMESNEKLKEAFRISA